MSAVSPKEIEEAIKRVNKIDIKRIKPILKDLEILWNKYPELRLCQLLHMVAIKSGWQNNDLYYIEDNVIAEQIKKELK
jgi:uncharacterized protein YihD (DUF1040 family)